MGGLHGFQSHFRDKLVPGRLDVVSEGGPAADRTGAAAAPDPRRPTLDLTAVRAAMDRREFDLAMDLLDRTLDTHPDDPDALALMGHLLECRGMDHAAYHEYRRALALDPENVVARAGMRHYCARFGLDAEEPRINPAAGH